MHLPTVFHHKYEDDLYSSKVYRRTLAFECDVSFTSSGSRVNAWSVFSGLIRGQISNLSVMALPVHSTDLLPPMDTDARSVAGAATYSLLRSLTAIILHKRKYFTYLQPEASAQTIRRDNVFFISNQIWQNLFRLAESQVN